MKRFVVIITSLLFIFVFIALNYLLWDRESLVTLKESNQASIDALSRINMNLSEENNKLYQQSEALRKDIAALEKKIIELEETSREQQLVMDWQKEFILALKDKINPEPIKSEAIDWISSISEKQFDKAYLKSTTLCKFWGNSWTPKSFTNYFVQNIEDIQLELDAEDNSALIEIIPEQTTDYNVRALIHARVSLKEEANDEYLQQGVNIIKLDFTYSERQGQWVIIAVNSENIDTSDVQTSLAGDSLD
ncbi:MAG: hypothetical protein GX283_04140 [Clostridiaceae bacterium]|jgi:cell division protein FtsB|nr:hypothetical protein [Clostridiaceae bacterium]